MPVTQSFIYFAIHFSTSSFIPLKDVKFDFGVCIVVRMLVVSRKKKYMVFVFSFPTDLYCKIGLS